MDQNIQQELEDSFLSCTICLQFFDHPRALPCLHTFCEECLKDYVTSFHQRNPRSQEFPCPVCRQDIAMPTDGVQGFPYNHLIASLRDTLVQNQQNDKHKSKEGSEKTNIGDTHKIRPFSNDPLLRTTSKCLIRIGKFSPGVEFVTISGIAILPSTGDVVIADGAINKVFVYSQLGTLKDSFTVDCNIRDVTITGNSSVLITVGHASGHLLYEYTLNGRLVAKYCPDMCFENPFGITLTSRGKFVVCGVQKGRIIVLDSRKRFSHSFGSAGGDPDQFSFPYFIARSKKDNLIISDCGNHRIKVHQMDGKLKKVIGRHGSKPGELFYPMGVCIDEENNIYVADANNYRVQMFSSKGQYLATPVNNTFDYGPDLKPVNVLFWKNKLIVTLRNSECSELQIFEWDPSIFTHKTPFLPCCFASNKVRDSGVYNAWS